MMCAHGRVFRPWISGYTWMPPACCQHSAPSRERRFNKRYLTPVCVFVQLAVMEVRDKISDPEFQHEVEVYAKTICQSLGDYKNMCIQYVDEYAPIAFALAEDYLDPRSVCGIVHMCPPPHAEG